VEPRALGGNAPLSRASLLAAIPSVLSDRGWSVGFFVEPRALGGNAPLSRASLLAAIPLDCGCGSIPNPGGKLPPHTPSGTTAHWHRRPRTALSTAPPPLDTLSSMRGMGQVDERHESF
jgi:hypothetical protein